MRSVARRIVDRHVLRLIKLWLEAPVEERDADGEASDRGHNRRLLTDPGDIELAVPRTRTFSALKVVRAYARRAKDVA